MGLFDNLFDFNRDGEVSCFEFALGMGLLEENEEDDDFDWDEENDDDY